MNFVLYFFFSITQANDSAASKFSAATFIELVKVLVLALST
jgi:hypothetical protein